MAEYLASIFGTEKDRYVAVLLFSIASVLYAVNVSD